MKIKKVRCCAAYFFYRAVSYNSIYIMKGVCMDLLGFFSFRFYAPINLFMSPSFRRRLSRSFSLSANFILISMIIDSIYYKRSVSIFGGQTYSESKFFFSLSTVFYLRLVVLPGHYFALPEQHSSYTKFPFLP